MKRLSSWLAALALLFWAADKPLQADFVLDAFTTPTSETANTTQASVGQTVTGSGLWDGRREFNITASFNVQSATLNISNGSLVHTVTPNAPSPLASLMLRYVDLTPTDTLPLPSGNILIENVSANSAWNLLVTLKGSNLPGGTTLAPSIAAGFSGNLLIPLDLFPSVGNLGTLTEFQFDFTNSSGGQLSFGTISVTAVPEPGTLTLAVLGCAGSACLRRKRRSKTKSK